MNMAASGKATTPSLPAIFKESAIAGLVAAVLAGPLLGFQLLDTSQGSVLGYRPSWILYAALAVFGGRFLYLFAHEAWGRRPLIAKPAVQIEKRTNARKWIGWALVAVAVLLPIVFSSDRNLIDRATLVMIYVMLGWGLNVVVGLAGLLDLGYVAFYAIGAYSYALLSQTFGLSFWICLPLAGAFAAAFGMILGFPVLRLRGDYLAIVTLGFGEIVRIVLLNWQSLTGGPNGIAGIRRPSFFGLPFVAEAPEGHQSFSQFFGLAYDPTHRVIFLYYLIVALALITNLVTLRLRRLPIGRAWEALREDETACRSLGINPTAVKLSAFAIGAMFAGFAGSFFATRQGFISPESFSFIESAMIVAIVVLGGMGSQIGIVLSALLLVGLPEWFRDLQLYRMLAFGGAMVLIMIWRPRGLLSTRTPTIWMETDAARPVAAKGAR
jgi:branched-chain amino acid transport system permease protein